MRYNTKREANVGTQSTEAFLYTGRRGRHPNAVTVSVPYFNWYSAGTFHSHRLSGYWRSLVICLKTDLSKWSTLKLV